MSLAKGHISRHRLEGSLVDTPLDRLLAALKDQLFTGTVIIEGGRVRATLELRGGSVDSSTTPVEKLLAVRDGTYEVRQRLPDLSGALGSSATLEGEVGDVPMPAIMRHCEENALTCTLIVVGGFDRGEIAYRAGEIVDVSLNGKHDLDLIVEILALPKARFRVAAPPIDLKVSGWPAVSREPTAPFHVHHLLDGK